MTGHELHAVSEDEVAAAAGKAEEAWQVRMDESRFSACAR